MACGPTFDLFTFAHRCARPTSAYIYPLWTLSLAAKLSHVFFQLEQTITQAMSPVELTHLLANLCRILARPQGPPTWRSLRGER